MTTFNINKNNSIEELQRLVEQNMGKRLSYMPESFNNEQIQALELFKQRLILEKTIDEAVAFNKSLIFRSENKNLRLATSAEELIEVFKLRSEVYTKINYQKEFPDIIEGLNFDKFDASSAVLYYRTDKVVTGTIRVVFDSSKKLPSENIYSFDHMRSQFETIGEMSRFIVNKESKGLSLEFKNLFKGVHNIFMDNKLDIIVSGLKEEHYKLYSKFGGVKILKNLNSYGTFTIPCLILSWNPSNVSDFFRKAFLDQKL